MKITSRGMALIIATCVAGVSVAFLTLVRNVPTEALLVTAVISFSSSYLLIFVLLDFVIFREIKKIYSLLDRLRKKDLSFIRSEKSSPLNPLKRINEEIYSYAALKQREIDELKKLEAFRKEFIADISHELKTPLFAAQGFVHTLLDGAIEDKSVRVHFLQKAAKSLDGLDMLVQDLLTLSEIETGKVKMHPDGFDLYKLTEEVFEQLEGKAEKKSITLKITGKRRPVMVYADIKRIHQVMTNLISNAVKYSGENSQVEVEFEQTKKETTITIKDQGEGIPPEDIKRIFERFYRVDKSRSREGGGTGLGLAIVKHILESHQSKVHVASTIGKGSTFSFNLSRYKSGKGPN
jgi:two-component system, OmpR family, phosphate regulon sensor histidine kinase PhoR